MDKREKLLVAYEQATYRVDLDPDPTFLRVGEPSPELDRWLAAQGAPGFAFLSAANPGSEPLSAAANERRHQRLLERVRESGLPAISGESYDAANGSWREASLLVAGLDRAAAIALARDFGQLALLIGNRGGTVELCFTGEARAGNDGAATAGRR